ncbi:hypothetical protein GX48_00220 [Paracoccidioides brasiliensis]|nr:hypothetical protein GX48_00220 [Paracoccidioides brasiliensis]
MSYPRKRTFLACDFCRQRKRRCDGKKPVCGNCTEAEANCHYQELPTQRLDPSTIPATISRRFERIETLLQTHSEAIAAISQQHALGALPSSQAASDVLPLPAYSTTGPPPQAGLSCTNTLHAKSPSVSRTPVPDAGPEFADPSAELPSFIIPSIHQTSTNSLLALPIVKSLAGEFPEDYFFRTESQRSPPPGSWMTPEQNLPYISRDVTDLLIATFFSMVHPCHPILDPDEFYTTYENVMATGLDFSLQSALCLVVFALGVVASQASGDGARSGDWAPGMEYFQPALQILMAESAVSLGSNLLLPQTLIFGGVYFAYIARPLHTWKLIHLASTDVQLLLSRSKDIDADESYKERILEACWSCFLIECDLLGEFNLPRSGIETFVDEMPFPKAGNLTDRDGLSYLAEISMRRLLNRVDNSICSRAETSSKSDISALAMSMTSLTTITSELDQQLLLWHNSVPDIIKPTLGVDSNIDDRERMLRIRYYAARHIIHRQYVLYAVSLPGGVEPTQMILEKSQVCIESCRLFLQNTGEILKKPSQYTWTLSYSSLGAVLVLTIASQSPHLKHLVPDILPLQQILMENTTRWAAPESSFETINQFLHS